MAAIGVAGFMLLRPHPSAPVALKRAPTTIPSTRPRAAWRPAPAMNSYIDVVRSENPAVPATQPLGVPLDLPDAAHLVLRDPIYLDRLGHLWITRAGAPGTEQSLRTPNDPPEHVVPENIVFVHWWVDDSDEWSAAAVVKNENGLELVESQRRTGFAALRRYHWESAYSWLDHFVVPSDDGVSVFDVDPNFVEHFHALPGMIAGGNIPLTTLDSRGVLAWSPWEHGRGGSSGVSRFVDGKWIDLTGEIWAVRPIQLLPLLDGSILQIDSEDAGMADKISLAIAPLENADIDPKAIADLVQQLGDPDSDKREAAFSELSRYGPGLAPTLEKLSADQPPEARLRLRQLLKGKITPALGGMEVVDNRLTVVNRQADGTVLFYAPSGVRIPRGEDQTETVAPAWLCLRADGRIDRALPATLVADQTPDACHLRLVRDDWYVCDSQGVRKFIGDGFVPLVREDEHPFTQIFGVDCRGRWLLKRPDDPTATLIIDPTIFDPTPRLPVWVMAIGNGSVGWTRDDFPVIKRGGAWILRADRWEPLGDNDAMITELPPHSLPPATMPATTQSTPRGAALLSVNGVRYFDGDKSLVAVDSRDNVVTWPLPPAAVGSADPVLVASGDGMLFLFNQPGRILRIKPTPTAAQPFELQATFTKQIPDVAPTRMWLDPAGRIDFECGGDTLLVMFPTGQIPPEIAQMMESE